MELSGIKAKILLVEKRVLEVIQFNLRCPLNDPKLSPSIIEFLKKKYLKLFSIGYKS